MKDFFVNLIGEPACDYIVENAWSIIGVIAAIVFIFFILPALVRKVGRRHGYFGSLERLFSNTYDLYELTVKKCNAMIERINHSQFKNDASYDRCDLRGFTLEEVLDNVDLCGETLVNFAGRRRIIRKAYHYKSILKVKGDLECTLGTIEQVHIALDRRIKKAEENRKTMEEFNEYVRRAEAEEARRAYQQRKPKLPYEWSKYFCKCKDMEEVKSRYYALAKELHPDNMGGDTEAFRAMKEEYTKIKKAS